MIQFKQENNKVWSIYNNQEKIISLTLIQSSVTNKYFMISEFVQDLPKTLGEDFDKWFINFISQYSTNEELRYKILLDNLPNFISSVDSYLDHRNIDYGRFVDESKAKKSSILFSKIEIEEIAKLSSYLKLYSIISNTLDFLLPRHLHKKIYNHFVNNSVSESTVRKIYDLIQSKTFRYKMTDKSMWVYLKSTMCKSIEDYVSEIFRLVMNSMIVVCELDKNPIVYFIGVTDECIRWFLRSVYKETVVYDDTSPEEIQYGNSYDSLDIYVCQDTMTKLKSIAFEKIYNRLEKKEIILVNEEQEDPIIKFHDRLSKVEHISPVCEYVAYPILSRITGITYDNFKVLNPDHAVVLSAYIYGLLRQVFKEKYKALFKLLIYFPISKPSTETTYKIKDLGHFIKVQNELNDFFGFQTKTIVFKILCHFVGRMSRVRFQNMFDSTMITIPIGKVERDSIEFFSAWFAGALEEEIKELKYLMDRDF